MAVNMINLVRGYLDPAVVSDASVTLGESESGISKAINALLPAVIGAFSKNANHPEIYNYTNQIHSSGLLSNLGSAVSVNNSLVSSIVSTILGDRAVTLNRSVSDYAGITPNATNSLLNLVVGAVLGSYGKHASDNGWDQSTFVTNLEEQSLNVSDWMPAGLTLSQLGFADLDYNSTSVELGSATDANRNHGKGLEDAPNMAQDNPKVEVHRAGETHIEADPEPDRNDSIWKWLLPLLLLLLAGWFLMRQCSNKEVDTTTTTVDSTQVQVDSTTVVTTDTRQLTDIDLNGTPLRAYPGGLEESMITFLNTGDYDSVDDDALKQKWYNFDNVNFKMNSATELEPGSEGQIENLASILKAYPDVKIKIGGYTDATGDAAQNKMLSQQRADFIKAELTRLGVGSQVLGAEGYGSEFATVPATASDAERAIDRKMAVRFAK